MAGVFQTPSPQTVTGFGQLPSQPDNSKTSTSLGSGAIGGSLISIAATPNAAAVGDLVLVEFCWALAGILLSTVTDTSGNTWNVVSHGAASNESGGYGWTIVTTGWASGANTVTGTLASGAPGGRCWAAAAIPAKYNPVFDQHNESTTTGNVNITLSSGLAQQTEEIFILDLMRTSPSGAPTWTWNQNFTDIAHINGSGTPGSGCAIGSYTNLVGQPAVSGGFASQNSADTHGTSIIAFRVTLQANPLVQQVDQVVGPGARAAAQRYNSQRRGRVIAAGVQAAAASAPAGAVVTPVPQTTVIHTSSRGALQNRTRDSNVYQPRVSADGVVVTPPRALVVSQTPQSGERRAPDRRAAIISSRWPGYQWAGLPPVTPLVEPAVVSQATKTAERRSPERHTNVIANRWPGYQWAALPPVNPLPRVVVQDQAALWQGVRGHRRSEVIAPGVQLAAAIAGVIPPTITPTKSIVVSQALQRGQVEQNRERRTHVVQNRWPGYQWVGLPPVFPLPRAVVQDQAALWREPFQQRRGRVIQGRAAIIPIVVPARPNVVHATVTRPRRRGAAQWSQVQRFVPTGTTPTLITTPATGYVSTGDTGIPASGSSGPPGAGDTGTVSAGLSGQVRI
jgi:hypothetical protein